MKFKFKSKNGMSLIELVLTIAIFALVISVVYPIFFVGVKSYDTSTNIGFAQQSARLPIDYINREIRDSKSVYLSDPIDLLQQEDFPYYSVGISEIGGVKYLVKKEYIFGNVQNPNEKIISKIDDLEFIPVSETIDEHIVVNEKKIDLSVSSVEYNKNKEYNKNYYSTILFSNHQLGAILVHDFDTDEAGDIVIPTDQINVLYYTKYK
jgi:prepilin-type N-terminal cleavage/methylation domain-containing protein